MAIYKDTGKTFYVYAYLRRNGSPLSKVKTGVPRSKESCIKQSITMTGKKRPEHSIVLMGKSRPTVICPHCDKTGGINNMSRWHFDNCKNKINMVKGPEEK